MKARPRWQAGTGRNFQRLTPHDRTIGPTPQGAPQNARHRGVAAHTGGRHQASERVRGPARGRCAVHQRDAPTRWGAGVARTGHRAAQRHIAMRHAGSHVDALRARVGVAAGLAISDPGREAGASLCGGGQNLHGCGRGSRECRRGYLGSPQRANRILGRAVQERGPQQTARWGRRNGGRSP